MNITTKLTTGALLTFSMLTSQAWADVTSYQLDPNHTSVVISWDHFGFSHPNATFRDVQGTLKFDEEHPENSSVSVTIPVKTVDTHVDALNKEFLGEKFFATQQYPTAKFVSTKVTQTGDHQYDVAGKLTIKDITNPVKLHATLNKQGVHPLTKKQAVGFNATGTVSRSAYGIDTYVPMVSDEVTLQLSTEASAAK